MKSDVHNRFLFDTDFRRQAKRDSGAFAGHQSDQNILDDAAYAKGFSDGQRDALLKNSNVTEQYFKAILNRIDDIHHATAVRSRLLEDKIISSIIDLGHHFISKLDPIDVLEDPKLGFLSIIERLGQETQLVLHVSEQDYETIEAAIQSGGSTAPVTLRVDPSIQDGDFELIWSDGGMKLERETLRDRFHKIEKTYLSPST